MEKITAFLKRKDIIFSGKRYGIDALGAMAQGLFCTLLVGTILNTIGQQFNIGFLNAIIATIGKGEGAVSYTIGGLASAMVGPGIAIAIGFALHCPPLVLFSLIPVGFAANTMGGAGGPLAVYFVAIVASEFGKLVSKETKVDILVTPIITVLVGIGFAALVAYPIGSAANAVGQAVKWATLQQPFLMGILVSLMILKCGWSIARETVDLLLGAPADRETTDALAEILLSGDGIIGYHDLLVHDYGPGRKFASVHAEIPDTADIRRAHEVVDALEVRIYNELGITAVIHTDPVTVGNAFVDGLKQSVTEIIAEISPSLSMHDFRITDGENRINLIFDLVVPFSLTPEDSVRAVEEIRSRVTALDSRFRTVIKIDSDYTSNQGG